MDLCDVKQFNMTPQDIAPPKVDDMEVEQEKKSSFPHDLNIEDEE